MRILRVGIGGVVATAVLTTVVYGLPYALLPRIDILLLLGSLLRVSGEWAYPVGAALHLAFGCIFAFTYALLWQLGIGRPQPRFALGFSFAHGLFAVAGLQILYALTPAPPPVYMTAGKSLILLLAHLAYGATLVPFLRIPVRGDALPIPDRGTP